MTCRLCLHGGPLSGADACRILAATGGKLVRRRNSAQIFHAKTVSREAIEALGNRLGFDINVIPEHFAADRIRLVVSDMDSTFITIECIDEIADMLGIKPQVAAITESAMRGDLDFPSALRERVALLQGLPVEKLEEVYQQRLRLNRGADILLEELRIRGIPFALVSGGFTYFTDRLEKRFALYASRANLLEVVDGRLTGRIQGKLMDASGKAEFLLETCKRLSIDPEQAIAIGDGANDLEMMSMAGLSVAYHAKPAVQKAADIRLNRSGLEAVCDLFDDPREA